ncbi:MAG: hypothetical protein FJW36_23055 [Acidobacteria bacterium]|nr:hypothetical protein [Acidobacteriota bacterium]
MSVYKRGEVWWYRFVWEGREIRLSSKQGNKRVAEQIEAAHKTRLAKGEVGILEKRNSPTLQEFSEGEFRKFIEGRFSSKPATISHYSAGVKTLCSISAMAKKRLDEITASDVTAYVERLRAQDYEVSSMNRKLAVLLRIFRLAMEWERVQKPMPRVSLLPGENRRERVLTLDEEERYLGAARAIGGAIVEAYENAKSGIRATIRGEVPIPPKDPQLLYHLALVLVDCGLRPEEAYRLRFDEEREGALYIQFGKTASARRIVPVSSRVKAILDWRREQFGDGPWVFPATTATGHINQSSLKKQHKKACVMASVEVFVPYTFRHTRLTRWAECMDPYTLAYLAGHSDFATTKRYVHPQADTIRAAIEKAEEAQTRHKIRHSINSSGLAGDSSESAIQ